MRYIPNETGDGKYKVSQVDSHLEAMENDFYYAPQLTGAEGKPINLDKGACEILKRYFGGEEILFRDDYIATKLWSKEDIATMMGSLGYDSEDEIGIDEVANNGSNWKGLSDCTDSEWNFIADVIKNTLGDVTKYIDARYETLKRELFMRGGDAIEEFLGTSDEIDGLSKAHIEDLMNESYAQMSDTDFYEFYHKFVLKEA